MMALSWAGEWRDESGSGMERGCVDNVLTVYLPGTYRCLTFHTAMLSFDFGVPLDDAGVAEGGSYDSCVDLSIAMTA